MLFGCSPTRGHFDGMYSDGEVLRVSGWMINPRRQFTSVDAVLNGELVATQAPQTRDDVATALPWIPHAAESGFRITLSNVRSGDRLEILGRRGQRVIARLESALRVDLDSAAPTPPAELIRRVAGQVDPHFFKADGLKSFTDFLDVVRRHCPATPIRRVLDWGCGCGRLSAHFLLDGTIPEFFGCDIDAEAIAWCQENLRGGKFQSIDPYPPTPYPDHFFDLVIGYSVFTHLRREAQNVWLREMRRVIVPGGLFLASTHGRFAAYFARPAGDGVIQRLHHRIRGLAFLASGFSDSREDRALDGIAPDGYYRGTFQTRAYTLREWSRYFEILELVEGGLAYQDLVVMRRPEDN